MNNDYLIVDPRPLEEFKDKTFSEFKKRDVFNELAKSMETGKVENTCFWVTECIVSGYTTELFEKLLLFGSKIVHINNPKLPQFLWLKYHSFMNSIDHISKKERKQYIHLRNTQSIRNCLTDTAVTLAMSPKTKRYDKYPKPKEDLDFSFTSIKNKMNATMQLLPSHIIKFTDPEELRVIMNDGYENSFDDKRVIKKKVIKKVLTAAWHKDSSLNLCSTSSECPKTKSICLIPNLCIDVAFEENCYHGQCVKYTTDSGGWRYGQGVSLGGKLLDDGYHAILEHGGSQHGYKTKFYVDREKRVGIVILVAGDDWKKGDNKRGANKLKNEIFSSFRRNYLE